MEPYQQKNWMHFHLKQWSYYLWVPQVTGNVQLIFFVDKMSAKIQAQLVGRGLEIAAEAGLRVWFINIWHHS
jgi:uncharacterized protein (DUF1684 family)